jgi:hypothetical protein
MTTFFDYQKIDALQYTHATKQYVGYISARTERFFRIGDDARLLCPTQYCIAASRKCQARASMPECRLARCGTRAFSATEYNFQAASPLTPARVRAPSAG